MRLYLDEDIASKQLTTRLTGAGHQVLPALRGEPDARVWDHAQTEAAAVVTMNVVDFVRLAETSSSHHGLLLVYRENDPTRDLTAADVAFAITSVAETYADGVDGLVLVLNQFRWPASSPNPSQTS